MKRILQLTYIALLVFVLSPADTANAQSAGFNTTYLVLQVNNGPVAYYDLQATTANPDFNGANLGTFCQSLTTGIVFKGAEHNVYKCGGCDLQSSRLYYRIYPVGSPAGTFVSNNIGYSSGSANGCGGEDQQWSNIGYNTDLLAGLAPGNYALEVYSDATVTCQGGTVFAGNGGANYIATFTVNAKVTYYADADGDGFGDSDVSQESCTGAPAGYITDSTDCDDTMTTYLDDDGDGFGSDTIIACGGVANSDDCDDTLLTYVDADADGFGTTVFAPCGSSNHDDCDDALIQYVDNDEDGFGSTVMAACNGVANNIDCDDTTVLYADNDNDGFGAGPFAPCGVLNNYDCDDNLVLYTDLDFDGFGTTAFAPCTGAANSLDCDDTVATYVDNDNDGFGTSVLAPCGAPNTDDCDDSLVVYVDADFDGFGTTAFAPCSGANNSLDCNDALVTFTDADADGFGSEVLGPCGVPNSDDCDDNLLLYEDLDNDGYGSSVFAACGDDTNTDCDDTNAGINPGAVEIGFNLKDDDCDGFIDEGFAPISTTIVPQYCNVTLSSIQSYIYANLVRGAQGYHWRVTTMTGPNAGQVQLFTTPLRALRLTQLGSYAYDTTYQIELAVIFGGFLQQFTPSTCTVTTPSASTALVNCGQTVSSINTVIYANLVQFNTGYRFRITDSTNPANTQILDRPLREFRMNMVNAFPVQMNTAYNVEVAVKNTDGTYLPYGSNCMVTVIGAGRDIDDAVFNAIAYPNPFSGSFTIDVISSATEKVTMKVYDMTGRLLEAQTGNGSDVRSLTSGKEYPSGVYNIIVTQGESVKSLRVVKR
jgi:hypothetical protein